MEEMTPEERLIYWRGACYAFTQIEFNRLTQPHKTLSHVLEMTREVFRSLVETTQEEVSAGQEREVSK